MSNLMHFIMFYLCAGALFVLYELHQISMDAFLMELDMYLDEMEFDGPDGQRRKLIFIGAMLCFFWHMLSWPYQWAKRTK